MVFELEIIRYIQSFATPILTQAMEIFTIIGEQYLALVFITWFYWNYDKNKGRMLGYAVFTSLMLNNTVKDILKLPRPIGQEGVISYRVETATGYSFPSGHTQNTTALFNTMAIMFKNMWFTILVWLLIIVVGFSRIYLGVHYPKDVIAAMVFGGIISLVTSIIYKNSYNKNAVMLATTVVLLPTAIFASSPDYMKSLGLMVGFTLGCSFEELFVGFTTLNTTSMKFVRYIIGMIVLGAVYIAGKLLLPEGNIFLLIRYALISFVGTGLYPFIFTKLKI